MNKESEVRKIAEEVTKHLADGGELIEAGWIGLTVALKLQETSPTQQREMRQAFFAGALHVFTSIMAFLEPGQEPTEKDMDRMTQLSEELTRFQKELETHVRSRN
jgi:hypothetical protein